MRCAAPWSGRAAEGRAVAHHGVAVAHAREVLPGGLEDLRRARLQRGLAEGLDAKVAQALLRGVEQQALVPGDEGVELEAEGVARLAYGHRLEDARVAQLLQHLLRVGVRARARVGA